MKTLYLLSIIYIGFTLTSCASTASPVHTSTTTPPTISHHSHKNPLAVTFYTKGKKPISPYKVIGEESIAKYNVGGIKKQEAVVRDAMSQLAAAMGGDAIINLKQDAQSISGTVIRFG